jgi:hypothetical protein
MMIVGISLALVSLTARAGSRESDATGSIAQARRLIAAQDHAAAVVVLEDLLIDAEAKEKPAILDLLRQSYTVLARQAQAAGREREAAYYHDNLDILNRGQSQPIRSQRPTPSRKQGPIVRTGLNPPPGGSTKAAPQAKDKPQPLPAAATEALRERLVPAPVLELEPSAPPEPPAVAKPLPPLSPTPQPAARELPPPSPKGESGSPAAANLRPDRDKDTNDEAATPRAPDPPAPAASPIGSRTGAGSSSEPRRPLESPTPEEADRFFSRKQYTEAGRCYAALAREDRLPENRKNHWAYCRMVDVALRMNARPRSASEWDQIEAEIQNIQQLAPKLWYGEYLRNKLGEVRQGQRRARPQSDNFVVRGSAPDESPSQSSGQPRRFPKLFGKSNANTPANPPVKPERASPVPNASADRTDQTANPPDIELPLQRPGEQGDGSGNGSEPGGPRAAKRSEAAVDANVVRAGAAATAQQGVAWQVHETANFRIFHCDTRLAESAGEAAETVRTDQSKRWGSPAAQRPWTPRCEIYLYPTGKEFAQATGQPETAPGFSTMFTSGNRVTGRRTSLRADHPQLLTAILPHEVTHVVLADLFTTQQLPRWADEGMAVLAEPSTEQNLRAAELHDALESGQVFDLSKLMSMMEYPDAKDWSLYYAQSISLTRFLVEQGTPERFIQFVREIPRTGAEAGLRERYGISGFAELHDRWREYARKQLAELKAPRPVAEAQASTTELK